MYQLILLFHVLAAILVIGLVLIQHGKGADIGASFGSGASATVFGSQGTGNFLFKFTGTLALLFFATSLFLSYLITTQYQKTRELQIPQQKVRPERIPIPVSTEKPASDRKEVKP
jgi:preprotein translocase subunit SecG